MGWPATELVVHGASINVGLALTVIFVDILT